MAKDLFTESDQTAIKAAIAEAEKNTSGEIRLHIERRCKEEVLDRAAFIFDQLEMQKDGTTQWGFDLFSFGSEN